jgi:hypothetical protein
MSAGHGHKREHDKTPSQLRKLQQDPDYRQLWQRWQRVDTDHDMVDLAGYNLWGTVRYIDRDLFHALIDPNYARHLGIGPIDTGLSPEDTIACLLDHEGIERTLMDADNDIDTYLPAHEFATVGEHECARAKKTTPLKYERGLAKAIEWCEKKTPTKVPQDFSCAPLLDDPDHNDKRVLEILKKLGIPDASKISKETVDYSKSSGQDRCDGCKHWLNPDRSSVHSLCDVVAGLVRDDRWCTKYDAAKQPEDEDGEGNWIQGGGAGDRAVQVHAIKAHPQRPPGVCPMGKVIGIDLDTERKATVEARNRAEALVHSLDEVLAEHTSRVGKEGPSQNKAMFVPDQLKSNAYRVLRVSANSTNSEIHKASASMRRAAKLDLVNTTEADMPLLGEIPRAESDIQAATSRLNNPLQRLRDRLFWFYLTPKLLDARTTSRLIEAFRDNPEAPAALSHDKALHVLFAAINSGLDDAGIQLWMTALRAWHQVVSDDNYWSLTSALEERGAFEPAAFPSEINALREDAVQLAAEAFLVAARDALARNELSTVRRVLGALQELSETGPWAARAQEGHKFSRA